MAVRYVSIRAPIEIGLSYMIKARVEWMRDERKADLELCELNELFFKTRPKEIFLQFTLEMKVEGDNVFIEGEEKILGKVRKKVASLSSIPSGGLQLPSSLRSFTIAVLVGDLVQKDSRKNKSPYHLRQVATSDDRVVLQWICTQYIVVLYQCNILNWLNFLRA